MTTKLRVGVIYGGKSGEHEVSIASAASVMKHLDRAKYEAVPIHIGKDGRWALAFALGVRDVRVPDLRCRHRSRTSQDRACDHWMEPDTGGYGRLRRQGSRRRQALCLSTVGRLDLDTGSTGAR